MNLSNFQAWQARRAKLSEVRQWLAHIGKTGRSTRQHTYVLNISPAHCGAPSFTVAGQYTEGGTNYWESPKPFNEAMKTVILARFTELSNEAVTLLERQTDEALIKAEGEIADIQTAINAAKNAENNAIDATEWRADAETSA